jgi:uncharacterized RDD family membrane protein YckC
MHHLLAGLGAVLWVALNLFLWGAVKSPLKLFLLSSLLAVGYFAAFFWYGSRRSSGARAPGSTLDGSTEPN